ncbi:MULTISPECIES: tetratricopeptide repeat protein [unclassified Bradyrhizobium]|uniref:tetratricopeptide repeat protein n=1 Tax=unclassified Bradyrhizobium TaxID=2631580 RepID=UPI0028EFE72E|nr:MULTISPECIES: tetratricopeptide repeat protein [unclassified Bradyrhizobium]
MGAVAVDQLLIEAADHYNAGRAGPAKALCSDILQAVPDHLPALHLSAILAFADGRMADGAELLACVFARDPNHAPAYVTLGDALAVKGERDGAADAFARAAALRPHDAAIYSKLGSALLELARFTEAEAAYRHALALDPALLRARWNLALAFNRQGRLAEAEAAYRELLEREPSYPGAWRALAHVLADQARYDEAVPAYLHALAAQPADAGLHLALGDVLYKQRAYADAAIHYRRAGDLAPGDAKAARLLGHALHEAGRPAEAVEAYRRAAALDPTDVVVLSNLAACLCGTGQLDAAIAACEHALALQPDHAPAHTNLGIIHELRGEIDDAVAAHRRAVAADPAYAKGYANLAVALRNAGDIDAALAASHHAISLAPDNALARYNHAHFLLMCGDLVNGFAEHRWGRDCPDLSAGMPRFDAPEWQGEPLEGRTLLLFAEYGIGDALQFVRYVDRVKTMGGNIVLQVQPAIAPLLRCLEGVTVVPRGAPLPPFDLQAPLMDLPRIFGTTLETIPVEVPYLATDPIKVAAWRNVLGRAPSLKVGVVWAGNPRHKGDRQRSLTAQAVLPRLVMPGVQLYSLQKEPRPDDALGLAELGADVIDLAPLLSDFAETAAAVAALDLVISVDTSVAHLAGALGRPVWVLLPYALDWRWLRDRADTPWYPTMRLFRQGQPMAWDGVLAWAAAELARVAAGERELLLPDLFDAS